MPRSPRAEAEGGIHHVISRGDHRETIFDDATDRLTFLERYREVAGHYGWVPLSYCLMRNHVHLVLETPARTLGDGCRDLFGVYARRRNARRSELGHVFQGRFFSRLVLTDEYFAQLLRYVALNPVVAGACATPEGWRWSGHRALRGDAPDPLVCVARVTELLSAWGGAPERRYASLFDMGNPIAERYGTEDPATWRPPLSSLLPLPCTDDDLIAARENGYRLAEIARHLGVHESTVSRRLKRKKGA